MPRPAGDRPFSGRKICVGLSKRKVIENWLSRQWNSKFLAKAERQLDSRLQPDDVSTDKGRRLVQELYYFGPHWGVFEIRAQGDILAQIHLFAKYVDLYQDKIAVFVGLKIKMEPKCKTKTEP